MKIEVIVMTAALGILAGCQPKTKTETVTETKEIVDPTLQETIDRLNQKASEDEARIGTLTKDLDDARKAGTLTAEQIQELEAAIAAEKARLATMKNYTDDFYAYVTTKGITITYEDQKPDYSEVKNALVADQDFFNKDKDTSGSIANLQQIAINEKEDVAEVEGQIEDLVESRNQILNGEIDAYYKALTEENDAAEKRAIEAYFNAVSAFDTYKEQSYDPALDNLNAVKAEIKVLEGQLSQKVSERKALVQELSDAVGQAKQGVIAEMISLDEEIADLEADIDAFSVDVAGTDDDGALTLAQAAFDAVEVVLYGTDPDGTDNAKRGLQGEVDSTYKQTGLEESTLNAGDGTLDTINQSIVNLTNGDLKTANDEWEQAELALAEASATFYTLVKIQELIAYLEADLEAEEGE